jgi:hypothetical protein
MDKAAIVSAVQAEFRKHNWDAFVDEPPSVALGRTSWVRIRRSPVPDDLHEDDRVGLLLYSFVCSDVTVL